MSLLKTNTARTDNRQQRCIDKTVDTGQQTSWEETAILTEVGHSSSCCCEGTVCGFDRIIHYLWVPVVLPMKT